SECSSWAATQLISALGYVHYQGYVHRDIKPNNVLVTQVDERPYIHLQLTDFGLARRYIDPDGSIRKCRKDGEVPFRGTKLYCTINDLKRNEHGRYDDLESLFYSIIYLSYKSKLPWKGNEETNTLINLRQNLKLRKISDKQDIYFDHVLESFGRNVKGKQYTDKPKYDKLLKEFLNLTKFKKDVDCFINYIGNKKFVESSAAKSPLETKPVQTAPKLLSFIPLPTNLMCTVPPK
ncbi:MAG: hypothetical protein MHPSP_002201, partial [Paramarteilia canceri]